MAKFTDPTKRMHEGYFNVSSCADESKHVGLEDVEGLPYEGLVPFFTNHAHGNIPVALATTLEKHNVGLTCSSSVMDDCSTYWSTGQVSKEDYCQIKRLSTGLLLMPIGHLEQLVCAGFAFLYQNGAKSSENDEEGNDLGPAGTCALYEGPNDMQLFFKFEGQRVCLQFMSHSPWDHKPCVHLAAGSW